MQQTLYGLLALLGFSYLGFAMHTHTAETEQAAYTAEIERVALDVALAWSARVKDVAFDEADVAAIEYRRDGDVRDLTPAAAFGCEAGERSGGACDPTRADDVDDFHGLRLLAERPVANGTLPLDVTLAVDYVQPADLDRPTGGSPSTAKRVTIRVTEHAPTAGRAPVAVEIAVPLTPAKLFLHQ